MKLDAPFVRLPVCFDIDRLQAEVNQFSDFDWKSHPSNYSGNSAIRLISRDGLENDDVSGCMLPTPHLARCKYIQQIIESFSVVVSRSRLMRLAPNSVVPEHSDINYHWHRRVRIHIPVLSNEKVMFHCGDQAIHMKEGEAWVFDSWRPHRVENPSDEFRVHLVVDTVGSASFWSIVERMTALEAAEQVKHVRHLPYKYAKEYVIRTEVSPGTKVFTADEMEFLSHDFLYNLASPTKNSDATRLFAEYVKALCRDWRALFALFGAVPEQVGHFRALIERAVNALKSIEDRVILADNGVSAFSAFVARIAQPAIKEPQIHQTAAAFERTQLSPPAKIEHPVFIVSAPRAGSTLLFETLAKHSGFHTIGGESHDIFERILGFNPASGAVPDNRLDEEQAGPEVASNMRDAFLQTLRTSDGSHYVPKPGQQVRLLEKTPKNILRVPFIKAIFPDAKFIFLYREPRENIASIIDAWLSNRWITYKSLPGRALPWSLLLPPGWQAVSGRAIEEVAAFQWCRAHEVLLDDFSDIPANSVTSVSYQQLLINPQTAIERLLEFCELPTSSALQQLLTKPLPLSRFTLKPPQADKWRKHELALRNTESMYLPIYERVLQYAGSVKY